jgi:hypothetical protein
LGIETSAHALTLKSWRNQEMVTPAIPMALTFPYAPVNKALQLKGVDIFT